MYMEICVLKKCTGNLCKWKFVYRENYVRELCVHGKMCTLNLIVFLEISVKEMCVQYIICTGN